MGNKKQQILLSLIFLLAFLLRFYHLGQTPPSLNVDEAAFGYNAYCILKTGQDEFSQRLPLAFKSFNDYKAPLTVYLIAVSEKIFGLNQFAVRFPSAFLGTFSVILSYFLIKEIFNKKKFFNLLLLTVFLFAISPWHIQHSRTGIDAGPALFFIILGCLFFFLAKRKLSLYLLSSFSFALSLYAYHSPRIFVPLLILGLIITSYKFFLKNKKLVFIFLVSFIIFLLPLIKTLSTPEARIRIRGASVFADIPKIYEPFLKAQIYDREKNNPFPSIFHNRRIAYFLEFSKGYLMHFAPDFFFTERGFIYTPPFVGLLYCWELPFILIGIYHFLRNLNLKNSIVIWWILAAPIPSAPTFPIPHPTRALNFLPTLQILCALGLLATYNFFKKKGLSNFIKLTTFSTLLMVVFFNFSFYLHQYYFHLPHQQSTAWNLEQKQLIYYLKQAHQDYKKIIVFPNLNNSLELIHIYFLFYWPIDPETYLAQGGTKVCEYGKTGRYEFQKFEFRNIFCFPNQELIDPIQNIPPNSMIITDTATYSEQKNFPQPIKKIYNQETNEPLILIYNSNGILKMYDK